jgi:hypothetical protein
VVGLEEMGEAVWSNIARMFQRQYARVGRGVAAFLNEMRCQGLEMRLY